MPFCAYCGKAIGAGRFCPYCGRQTDPALDSVLHVERPASRLEVTFSLIGVASMIVAVAASLLPWVSYSGVNVSGLQRDGRIMLALCLLGIVSGLLGLVLDTKWPFLLLAILGIAVAALAITDILDVSTTAGLSIANVGSGLFLGAAAGLAAVVAGVGGMSLGSDTGARP